LPKKRSRQHEQSAWSPINALKEEPEEQPEPDEDDPLIAMISKPLPGHRAQNPLVLRCGYCGKNYKAIIYTDVFIVDSSPPPQGSGTARASTLGRRRADKAAEKDQDEEREVGGPKGAELLRANARRLESAHKTYPPNAPAKCKEK
jgi:hypothetical protein